MSLLTTVLLLINLTGAQVPAENHSPQREHPPRGTNAEITHKCDGIEKTAERDWLLYNSNPEPWRFLPLILSEVHIIGAMSAGQQFTICRRVDRSTWRKALRLAGGARARQPRRRRKVFGRLDNDAPRRRERVGARTVSRQHRGPR